MSETHDILPDLNDDQRTVQFLIYQLLPLIVWQNNDTVGPTGSLRANGRTPRILVQIGSCAASRKCEPGVLVDIGALLLQSRAPDQAMHLLCLDSAIRIGALP
jgi:hypothetical protein